MATVKGEYIKGRRRKIGAEERQYVIKEATTTLDALTTLIGYVPATVPSSGGTLKLIKAECEVEEIVKTDGTYLYMGFARWGTPSANQQEAGDFSITFDISGQTQRLTQSLTTRSKQNASGKPARDFKGAINVNSDGTVEGVDIIVPSFTFTLNYTADPNDINDAYIATLRDIVGTINDASFKGFGAGELLLTKVSGSKRNEEAWDISFGFSVSKTRTSLTVGGISVAEKRGWDYMWVYYSVEEDTAAKVIIKRPANVFVEQVYYDGNYGLLGLP